ncbi:MAG: MotA/TolQ/ExbB proton channel family protein [Myxococcales bacterium]|nr:MotA/TolQ/ExbB proton channel family protein [Myxococcota bacterium]MDW8281683.1 MotA/TolQ/ExbB proton channel family protein [Myxococcales bacterium]
MSGLRSIADAFHEGGWPMWPILLLMIVSWGIMIERVIYLRKAGIDKEKLLALLKSQIMAGNIQGAIKVCSGNPTPLTRIIQAGLTKFNRPDAEVQAAMDEAALRELPKIEARTGYLAMLGNVATLVGLLGTILGLIHSFAGVAGVDPSMKATLLAKGISEAMHCTAFGLICAVPALLGFAILNGWTQSILDDINEVSVQVVNLVVGHRNAMKGGTANS